MKKEQEIIEVVEPEVNTEEIEWVEEPTQDEPKPGLFKRIRNGARNFGENHQKLTKVLKGIGLISIGVVAGIAGATLAEKRKWTEEVDEPEIGENCTPFLPEESEETNTVDELQEFSELNNESESEG